MGRDRVMGAGGRWFGKRPRRASDGSGGDAQPPQEPAGVEAAVVGSVATLVAYGDTGGPAFPGLDAVLADLVARHPSRLTVDLSEATGLDREVLDAVARRGRSVPTLWVRVPDAATVGSGWPEGASPSL